MAENTVKNKNLWKSIILLLLFLILTWLIGINSYFSNSNTATENNFDKEKAISLYPEAVLSVNNCEQVENRFFTQHEDPQIFISPPKNRISSTMIEFAEPVPIDSSVKIYYANKKSKNLNEENSVLRLLPKGSSKIIINLPLDIYTTLRYDIDIFGEWYEIKGIYASEAKRDNTLFITLIISICIFVLWIFGIKTGKMDVFHEKITNLFKSNNTVKDTSSIVDTPTVEGTVAVKDTSIVKDAATVNANQISNKEINIAERAVKNKNQGILLLFLIPTWLIGINIYFSNSNTATENNFDKVKAISLYPEAVLSVNNCEQVENRFFTQHEDPQIFISPPKNRISSTMIEFAEPVPIDSSVKIYYANKKSKNLNEENSVLRLLPKGSSKIIINLPLDIYTTLRYDIDIFGEWYEIKGIYASEAKRDNTLFITLIISICIFVLWIFGIKIGKMNVFHEKITNLFKSNNINNSVKDITTVKDDTTVKDTNTVRDTTAAKDAAAVINTITIKTKQTSKIFLIAIFLLIILKLSLVMGNKMLPYPSAVHDDMLMYSRAVSISNGEWLGAYNNLILAKGAFFSIWLAFLNLLSIPMLIGNEILNIASCLFLIWCINDIVPNKKMLYLIFAVLLFNPIILGDLHQLRIYRDSIFPALIIFVFAGTIGMFLKKDKDKKMLICSSVSGIFLSAAWHTREDTFWIIPFVIVADIVIAFFLIAEKKYKDNIKKYIYLILPFIILIISNLLISSLNNIKYGRFITNDFMSKDFQGAYGALTRVAHEEFDYYNPVPEEVRMKIYQISPSFNELRPYLDEGPLEGWKDQRKMYKWPLHDFYAWFMWALRDAVSACGYYENPQRAKEYYERLAKEVNNACDAGLLPSRTGKRATLASPFSREYIAPALEIILKASLYVIKYDQVYYPRNNLLADAELFTKIRDIEFYLNQLSWYLLKYSVIELNMWAFDSLGEDIDIKITDSKNQKVNATIVKSDSMDVYNHFKKEYKTALKARFNIKFDFNSDLNYYLNISNKKGEQINILINKDLRGGYDSTSIICHIDSVYFSPNKHNDTKIEKVKNIISNSLLKINRMINPVITLIALLSLLILTSLIFYRLFKRMEICYYKEVIILWGLLLAFLIRTVMIAYVHVSSFPAINTLYLSSSYPIMLIFNCISICCFFCFIRKHILIKKQRKNSL